MKSKNQILGSRNKINLRRKLRNSLILGEETGIFCSNIYIGKLKWLYDDPTVCDELQNSKYWQKKYSSGSTYSATAVERK